MNDIVTKAFLNKLFPSTKGMIEGFDIHGLDESGVVTYLEISWPELKRWREDGRFPPPNATVMEWVWKWGGKFTRLELVKGWTREIVDAVKPDIQSWGDEHKANCKKRRQQLARNKRIIKSVEVI